MELRPSCNKFPPLQHQVLTHSKTVFQLIATNEHGLTSEPDTVSITVNAENETPSFEGILGS